MEEKDYRPEDRRYLSSLNREDLWLSIEAYRNQIQMSTAMVEKQQVVLDRQATIIEKLQRMVELQSEMIKETRAIVPELRRDVNDRIHTCAMDHQGVIDAITEFRRTLVEKCNDLINRVSLGWIGMGTILLALIGLFFK